MRARLPIPNSDHDSWGSILNHYLLMAHNDDGTLRQSSVNTPALQDGAVTTEKLDPTLQAVLRPHIRSAQPAGDTMLVPADTRPKVTEAATTTLLSTSASFAPEDYGCARYAPASVNDAAIAAAIADATAANGIVQFTGKGLYNVSNAILQDVTKFVVRGCRTVLNVDDAFTGDAFWSVFASADYPYTYNQGAAIDGIILQGSPLSGPPMAAAAIRIGHTTYTNSSLFTINNVGLQGFATGFKYVQNAWRIKLSNCRVTGGVAFSAAPGLANFGENMLVENCMIESYGPSISIGTGEWNFINCSFDNTAITVNGNCVVRFMGCHLEPHTIFPCLSLTHAQATVIMNSCSLVLDPTVAITTSPFSVTRTNVSYGLIIRNLDTIQSANFNPQITNTDCLLVSGGGRVDIQGFASNINGFGFVIADSLNLLYNGDAEKGTTVGWSTYATYGGPATFSVDATTFKSGRYSFKLAVSASSIYVGQAVPCRPGQWLFAQAWNKFTIDNGTGNTFIDIDFLSSKGDVILTTGYVSTTATIDWTFRRLAGTSCMAPPGTASARVYIGVVGSASATAWYDNLIINVA